MKLAALCLLLTCLVCPAQAVDMTRPAHWQVTVQDAAGRALPDVSVTLNAQAVPLNAAGQAAGESRAPEPAADIFWNAPLHITKPGFLPYDGSFSFFPGARMERRVTLYPARTTRVSVRGPHGEVIAGVRVLLHYETNGMEYQSDNEGPTGFAVAPPGRTDAQGDFVFTHPPLDSGFLFLVGGFGRPRFSQSYPDAARVMATLTPEQMAAASPARPMRLKLLTPDGKPATGWRVGPDAHIVSRWAMTGGLNGPWHHLYQTEPPLTVGADGAAVFSQSEDHLIVFSPEGAPLLYPLHPATWPKGQHRVTLRLPAVRQMQSGQVRNPDGTPAANLTVSVQDAVTAGVLWDVRATAPAGTVRTDAEGRFAVPQYFGIHYTYTAKDATHYTYDLSTADGLVAHFSPVVSTLMKPADYKEVAVAVHDEQGRPLPKLTVSANASGGGFVSVYPDAAGLHLFVPNAVSGVTLETKEQNWKPLTKTLALPGTGDRHFTLTIPQALHLKPLTGVVLAPDGSPVSGASLSLLRVNPNPGVFNQDYAGFSTKTDAQGRFAFAAAPDAGEINLYRFGPDDQPNLPGWTDTPQITPLARDMTVRLQPVGSVLAHLPLSVTALPDRVYLQGKDYHSPHFDGAAHTLHWSALPPGKYVLSVGDKGTDKPLQTVIVRPKLQTAIDLRSQAAAFPPTYVPTVISVNVHSSPDGTPVSGAVVTLWTDQMGKSDYDAALPADLSDENGEVRLPLGIGQEGVAVAHVPGLFIGWDGITGAVGTSSSFGLSPAKTLAVHLPALTLTDGKVPYETRRVWVRPMDPQGSGGEAIFAVLGFGKANAASHFPLLPDMPGTWLAEDLPPGQYHLSVEGEVTLPETGPAVVDVGPPNPQ